MRTIHKKPKVSKNSLFEQIIGNRLKAAFPDIVIQPECVFLIGRRFRFDFALVDLRIAVEYEGGTWSGGRHTRGAGYQKDCEKYNLAALNGWRVLRYTSGMIDNVIPDIKALLSNSNNS